MVDSQFLSHSSHLRHRQHHHRHPFDVLHSALPRPPPHLSFPDLPSVPPPAGEDDSYPQPPTDAPPPTAFAHPDFNPASYRDNNSLWTVSVSICKIVTCFVAMMVTTFLWSIVMVILLPSPCARIKQGNIYGHVTGRMLMWILGNPIKISGRKYADTKAIYICNHASPLDIFLVMWLTPTGTVGVAKKEIIWYPLFGQLYVLARHLRIDRSNSNASIRSMQEAATEILEKNLSLVIFPEGTRSKTGRLMPFKKGFVHLAIQTKRPIVPMVLTGTHLAWQKDSLHVRPAPLTVTFLPPIETDGWNVNKVDEYVEMLHALFVKHLPDSQKPFDKVQIS